jgi:hypothetical protein
MNGYHLSRRQLLGMLSTLAFGCSNRSSRPVPIITPGRYGLNFGGISYYSTELIFNNLFHQSQPWTSQREGEPYGKGGPIDMTSEGWIQSLKDGQYAESILLLGLGGRMPEGKYLFRYQGEGTIEFDFGLKFERIGMNEFTLEIPRQTSQLTCRIRKIPNPKDPPRQFELYLPGSDEKQTFQPDFLARLKGFSALRFMGLMQTNNSPIRDWNDRPKTTDATQADEKKGVAIEQLIELANQSGIPPWFCLPHQVDDDFVKHFAELIEKQLDPKSSFYLEYSNETWNPDFQQTRYCQEQGKRLALARDDRTAGLRFFAKRSRDIFRLVAKTVGLPSRMIRVVGTQFADPSTGKTILEYENLWEEIEGLAIAPYFGVSLGDPKTVEKIVAMSVDEIIHECRKSINDNSRNLGEYNRLAKSKRLELLAYEGGQHLVGYLGAENDDRMTKLFQAVNRDPRMSQLYEQDLNQWEASGAGLFCTFLSMGGYSKWGSWGMLEYPDQDPKTAPKWQALQKRILGK